MPINPSIGNHAMLVALLASVVGCTWVPMSERGHAVRVLAPSAESTHCQRRGEIEVSVKSQLAFFHRNPLKVQDELETLARNEAPSVHANAVQALEQPRAGTQRFAAFACPSTL